MNRTCQIVSFNQQKKMCGNFYSILLNIFNRKHKRELITIVILDSKAISAKYLHLKRMKI